MNINKDNSLNSLIQLSCRREGERTYLDDRYFDIPYKLTHYGNPLFTDYLEMILMSASPGIMEGDLLNLKVHCKEGAAMKFYTQSYNKIHQMPHGKPAVQTCDYQLDENAKLQYIPHPTIPYANSIFVAKNNIHLKKTSHLIWGDIISGGRIHSGERFALKSYHTQTKVFMDEKLILLDNQKIEPETQPVEDLLFFEGYTHQGTLLIISKYADDFKKELDEILLEQFTDSDYGFTQCTENALMIRIMSNSGDGIHDWLMNIGNMAWSFIEYKEKQDQKAQEIASEAEKEEQNLVETQEEPKEIMAPEPKKATAKTKNTAKKSSKVTKKKKKTNN
ncbi:MAG: urease accessory protein UreD [Bacteroidota bacterium]|nr:urease accessory protein UreD [Bacteroidota bacterium]